jgi:hypothetical protein
MSASTGILSSLPQVAVNAGVFVGMILTTILGWKFGKKKTDEPVEARVAGAMLTDSTTLLMLSEANRVLSERVGTNTHVVERNSDTLKEICNELERLNRNLEHLMAVDNRRLLS